MTERISASPEQPKPLDLDATSLESRAGAFETERAAGRQFGDEKGLRNSNNFYSYVRVLAQDELIEAGALKPESRDNLIYDAYHEHAGAKPILSTVEAVGNERPDLWRYLIDVEKASSFIGLHSYSIERMTASGLKFREQTLIKLAAAKVTPIEFGDKLLRLKEGLLLYLLKVTSERLGVDPKELCR